MRTRTALVTFFAAGMVALGATGATAAVTFDPTTGSGFVGKGDVQLALGLNNAQLNAQAGSLVFTHESTTVSEVSWVCTNTEHKNEQTQERERTTVTTTSGVVSATARDNKKQITGFILSGFRDGAPGASTTEGPKLNSCPAHWTLTTPAGEPDVVVSTGGLLVNGVAL